MGALLAAAVGTGALRRLLAAWAAVAVGGWAFMVALAVYAYGEGGATAVGLVALIRMLPAGAAAPFGGLVADRMSRRDLLVAITLLRATVLVVVAVAVALGAGLAVVVLLAALFTVLQTAHRPAQLALLPHLARTPTQLAAANAVASGIDNGAFLFGSLLGGVLVSASSAQAGFAVTAALLLAGAAGLFSVPRDPVPEHREATTGIAHSLREGFSAIAAEPDLRLVVGVLSVSTLAEGVIDVLVVVVAVELVDLGGGGVGWLNSAWGAGGVLGGGAALLLLGRGRLAGGFALGAGLAGLPLVALAAMPSAPAALLALVVVGVGYALMEVSGSTLLQRLPADDVVARTTGVLESLYWVTTGIGAALAPVLLGAVGTRGALLTAGLALPLAVLARRRALSRLESGRPVPERPYALLRSLPVFAPLPLAAVETVALRCSELHVDAGCEVITEGDRGDRFYAVCAGHLRITRAGAHRDLIGAGDFFGEIALLHDAPRNATVTATEPCHLLALERDVFLEAVGAHPRSSATARRVARERSWMPA